ncbi:UPF0481 protein At3g47200-like [Mercurialis annua]|uniref:UPF0481 protein At3g47200-like n=1 Tax=Mercurialis annua TaxID=3986 RepID=UPI00215E1C42|nr:UPF0481 protein At3g47200-like [Mercurialis annua]
MLELERWAVEISNELEKTEADTKTETERWRKSSIYKVPASIADVNTKLYTPQMVSFGPYHHGRPHLIPMEEHKRRALLQFLKRAKKPLKVFVEAVAEELQCLKDCYYEISERWKQDDDGFVQLMILDGCFMLEILRVGNDLIDDYAPDDPIFGNRGRYCVLPYIRVDMLMLENQLPLLVLYKMLAVESGEMDEEPINRLILKFCFLVSPGVPIGNCLHALDIYRKMQIFEFKTRKTDIVGRSSRLQFEYTDIDLSATDLYDSGIRFRKSKNVSISSISFRSGVLKLPAMVYDLQTERLMLNLMAFEWCHSGISIEVTEYICFMYYLIRSDRDVALLRSYGIIQNYLDSDRDVVLLLSSLSRNSVTEVDSKLNRVRLMVNGYCTRPWNKCRAYLVRNYFKSPWTAVNLIAAIILFLLTFAQTVYTVYPYYHRNEPRPRTP